MGRPINPAAAWEYPQACGRWQLPIVDTFWQTGNRWPGAGDPMVPGRIAASRYSRHRRDKPAKTYQWPGGIWFVKRPAASMIRTIWGDDALRQKLLPLKTRPEVLCTAGDEFAIRDAETGYFTITGRIDDVLNVSDMGAMEIESALLSCAELVAGRCGGPPDDTTGGGGGFVGAPSAAAPVGDDKTIAKQLRDHVGKEIGPIAKPRTSALATPTQDHFPAKSPSPAAFHAKGEAITQDTYTGKPSYPGSVVEGNL